MTSNKMDFKEFEKECIKETYTHADQEVFGMLYRHVPTRKYVNVCSPFKKKDESWALQRLYTMVREG